MGGTKPVTDRRSGFPRSAALRLRRVGRPGILYVALAMYQALNAADALPFAYVANAGSGDVSVINTTTSLVATTIAVGLTPEQVAITPNGQFAYVTNSR